MVQNYEHALTALSELQSQELSIIRLSEPISLASSQDAPKRSSDASAEAAEGTSPSMLAADLAHYEVGLHEGTRSREHCLTHL